jgi:putative phosphoribosyl transferase
MYFEDRLHAAAELAEALRGWRPRHPLVLAIPRGAVPMGNLIAEALDGDLDVVLVRKLGAPWNPELAVGAVDESGWTYISEYARALHIDESYLAREREAQLAKIRDRRALYTPARAPLDARGRSCIVVDDGLATGATMIAALHAVRAREPARLACAVPVASREALELVRPLADQVVCLLRPPDLGAVGAYYRTFDQVGEGEVCALLAQDARRRPETVP